MTKQLLIVHIDPAIGTTNLGDEIISESVAKQLRRIFPTGRIIQVSSRDIGAWSGALMSDADYVVFGGTNALSSDPLFGYRQFSMGRFSALRLKRVVLLGVGWWQYQSKFGIGAKQFYRRLLRSDCIHSVRDDYTKAMLMNLGITNVANTGCPTMWDLESYDCGIPESALITLTDYHQNEARDLEFLREIVRRFSRVLFWPQGTGDLQYLARLSNQLRGAPMQILGSSLAAFDEALRDDVCYVGTRLHAGVRAMQSRRPAFILPVDNRAREISKTDPLHLVEPNLAGVKVGELYRYKRTHNPSVKVFVDSLVGRMPSAAAPVIEMS